MIAAFEASVMLNVPFTSAVPRCSPEIPQLVEVWPAHGGGTAGFVPAGWISAVTLAFE
jgi:hypothetical protein